jgi:hypothetical protein
MKLIFECETELGLCDRDRVNGHFGDEFGDWIALAHTTAAMTGSKGLLRIEQRCYLRSLEAAEEVRTQSWVKPDVLLEPVVGSREEVLEQLKQGHEHFVERARQQLGQDLGLLLTGTSSLQAPAGAFTAPSV